MKSLARPALTALVSVLVTACGSSASYTTDVAGATQPASKGNKTVLIYFANETATYEGRGAWVPQMHDYVVRALEARPTDVPSTPEREAALQTMADTLRDDPARFDAAFTKAVSALETVCDDAEKAKTTAVAVFSNRGYYGWRGHHGETAATGHYWSHCGGVDASGTPVANGAETWDFTPSDGTPERQLDREAHPLADRNALVAALAAVKAVYPASEYEYVVVTHSHGGSGFAAKPLAVYGEIAARKLDDQRFPTELQPEDVKRVQELYLALWGRAHSAASLALGGGKDGGQLGDYPDSGPLDGVFGTSVGIDAFDYGALFETQPDMTFRAVLAHACKTVMFPAGKVVRVHRAANVKTWIASEAGVSYDAVPWAEVMATSNPAKHIANNGQDWLR